MAIDIMWDKVDDEQYLSPSSFLADVDLIVKNCKEYNPADARGKALVHTAQNMYDTVLSMVHRFNEKVGYDLLDLCENIAKKTKVKSTGRAYGSIHPRVGIEGGADSSMAERKSARLRGSGSSTEFHELPLTRKRRKINEDGQFVNDKGDDGDEEVDKVQVVEKEVEEEEEVEEVGAVAVQVSDDIVSRGEDASFQQLHTQEVAVVIPSEVDSETLRSIQEELDACRRIVSLEISKVMDRMIPKVVSMCLNVEQLESIRIALQRFMITYSKHQDVRVKLISDLQDVFVACLASFQ